MRNLIPILLAVVVLTSGCDQPSNCGVISHEGYDYSTVLIGDQCWFSENCRYLPEVSPSREGSNTDPYYYVYDYHGTNVESAMALDNYSTYGVLYNWSAVMTEGICPSGWHIPSEEEFEQLRDFLGVEVSENMMKSISGWNNGNGSYSSGFNGLPGGFKGSGAFNDGGYAAYWWSSSASGSSTAWARVLDPDNINGNQGNRDDWGSPWGRFNGFSARCIKD